MAKTTSSRSRCRLPLACWAATRRHLVVRDGALHCTGIIRSFRIDLADVRRACVTEHASWARLELRDGSSRALTPVLAYSTSSWRWRPDERTLEIVDRLNALIDRAAANRGEW